MTNSKILLDSCERLVSMRRVARRGSDNAAERICDRESAARDFFKKIEKKGVL